MLQDQDSIIIKRRINMEQFLARIKEEVVEKVTELQDQDNIQLLECSTQIIKEKVSLLESKLTIRLIISFQDQDNIIHQMAKRADHPILWEVKTVEEKLQEEMRQGPEVTTQMLIK